MNQFNLFIIPQQLEDARISKMSFILLRRYSGVESLLNTRSTYAISKNVKMDNWSFVLNFKFNSKLKLKLKNWKEIEKKLIFYEIDPH